LYLDPTQTYQRGEINDVATAAYQYALLLKPGETDLRFVTPSENNIVRIFERLNVNLTDSSTLDVNSTYRGARADNIRGFLANTSVKDLEDAYKNYYAVTFDDIKLLNEIAYEDDTVYNVLKVNEAYQIPSIRIEED